MKIKKGVAWERTMLKGSALAFGHDFWSNGHFIVVGDIPVKAKRAAEICHVATETKATITGMCGTVTRAPHSFSEAKKADVTNRIALDDKDVFEIGGASFDEDYLRVFNQLFKSPVIHIGGKEDMATVYSEGLLVGALMPIRTGI